MSSWVKSYWIAFCGLIIGFIFSILWIIIAGLVLSTYFKIEIKLINDYIMQNRISEIFYLNEFLIVGLIIVLFLFLSSLSFYAALVKYTLDGIKKDLDKVKQK